MTTTATMPSLVGAHPSKTENCDAVDLILQDHRLCDSLFNEIPTITDANFKKTRFALLREELSKHTAVEEQLLYPVVRRLGNKDAPHAGDHLADKSLKEHQEAKELLARLESMDLSHSEWPALFEKLKTSVQTHVMEEESQILPMLRSRMSEDNLHHMATAIEALKKIAPTHPHPAAPNTQPGVAMAGIVSGFMDRIKDMFEGVEKAEGAVGNAQMAEALKERVSEPISSETAEHEGKKEEEEAPKGKGKRGRPRKTTATRTRTQPEKKSKITGAQEKGMVEEGGKTKESGTGIATTRKRVTRSREKKSEESTTATA